MLTNIPVCNRMPRAISCCSGDSQLTKIGQHGASCMKEAPVLTNSHLASNCVLYFYFYKLQKLHGHSALFVCYQIPHNRNVLKSDIDEVIILAKLWVRVSTCSPHFGIGSIG